MQLASYDFKDQEKLDLRFTCDGHNFSPELNWWGAPRGTQSFALSCYDPDASGGFTHWLVVDIPTTASAISQNGYLPSGAYALANDFGQAGYGGPCPPAGKAHRYVFTLYALNVEKLEDVTAGNFYSQVKAHMLDSAELTGLYERQ